MWSPTPVLQTGVAPEILFIERCVRLLKPGTGKVCIVLPDGILGNPDDEYIRVWLLKHCEVLALVDMPVELFLPKVGIQTHLVFLRRKSTDEMNQDSLSGEPALQTRPGRPRARALQTVGWYGLLPDQPPIYSGRFRA